MSRWNHNEAMGRPWCVELKPDRPGGGYRLKGSSGDYIRIYGSRADVDLIIEAVNSMISETPQEIETVRDD